MNDETNAKSTSGGMFGHIMRRLLHVSIILIPIIYYCFINSKIVVCALLVVLVIFEAWRIYNKKVLFGQRKHEFNHISSFAWGLFAAGLVLLFAPKAFAYPILISCAIVDPLLGEIRQFEISKYIIAFIGVAVTILIWYALQHCLPTAWYWPLIMGPIIVASEWPNLRYIDDNAMMQLVPLILVIMFVI